jgi:hypothetical protein
MKWSLFITLIFLNSIPLYANELKMVWEEMLTPQNSCVLSGEDPLYYFENDETKLGIKRLAACPDDEKSFNWYLFEAHCRSRFGSTGYTCAETDATKILARLNNSPLMDKMVSYTKNKFEQYKKNLVQQCCKDKIKCTQRFNNVRLDITQDSKVDAHYESDNSTTGINKIGMTLGKIASAYNTENIDRVLLAELGHACQFALISEDEKNYAMFTGPKRCERESGLLSFKEGLGEELSACLINEIDSQIKELTEEQRSKFCFGKWYREAFSDMMFRKHYSSIYHWTYDLGRRTPSTNYASVTRYVKCDMPSSFREQLCPKKE